MRGGVACAVSVAVCLSALISSNAPAAEWSGSATFFLREEYNDNILMTAGPHDTVWGSTAFSLLTFAMRNERLQLKAAALTEYTYYAGQQGLNTTIYDLTLSPIYTTGRAAWGLTGEVKQDLTLGGELQETGVVLTRNRRRIEGGGPSLTWSLTERASVQWQYQFTRVRYPGSGPESESGLVDYDTQVAAMTSSLSVTERDTVTAIMQYTDYTTLSGSFRSQNYGAQIGLKHGFSEMVSGELSGGASWTVTSPGSGLATDHQWGGLLNSNLERQSELMLLKVGLSQQLFPSGGGYLVQTEHLTGSIRRDVTSALTVFLSADAYWTSALGTTDVPDNRYHTAGAGMSWKWSDHWSTEASYRYSRQGAPSVATANVVSFKIAFNGDTVFSSP